MFRNRASPLVLLHSLDDTIIPQEMKKLYATPNSRKRRSNAYRRRDDKIINKKFNAFKPQRDVSTFNNQNQLLQQN